MFDSAARTVLKDRFVCDSSSSTSVGVGFTWFVPCFDKAVTSLALTLQIEGDGFMNVLLRAKGVSGAPIVSSSRSDEIAVFDVSSVYLLWLKLVGDVEFKKGNEDVTTFGELVGVVSIMNQLILSVGAE